MQYLLASQPFGELDIKCERGVLIPRYVFVVNKFDGVLFGLKREI